MSLTADKRVTTSSQGPKKKVTVSSLTKEAAKGDREEGQDTVSVGH